mmetsp:Transcript_29398/g.44432  ORF Transcript_29398/g.44432 Transcript_29398/m.44432 type:complete len:134 (-) Transcript_29398:78-479(-)
MAKEVAHKKEKVAEKSRVKATAKAAEQLSATADDDGDDSDDGASPKAKLAQNLAQGKSRSHARVEESESESEAEESEWNCGPSPKNLRANQAAKAAVSPAATGLTVERTTGLTRSPMKHTPTSKTGGVLCHTI